MVSFTQQGLEDYITGNFEQVDDIEGAEEIPAFLFSVIRKLYPELEGLTDKEMEWDNVVQDALIGANSQDRATILNYAVQKYLLL
jgi:hypothetical protein